MRGFILGVIVTIVVVAGAGFAFLALGFFDVSAVPDPGSVERTFAELALDGSVEKRAPKEANPVALNDGNLIEAARIYEEHCAMCHGSKNAQTLNIGPALSPRGPNLLQRARHDPDGAVFWVTENGIRMTGMPAWGKNLSKDDIWKLALLLKNVDRLSPEVTAEWEKSVKPQEPPAPEPAPAPAPEPAKPSPKPKPHTKK